MVSSMGYNSVFNTFRYSVAHNPSIRRNFVVDKPIDSAVNAPSLFSTNLIDKYINQSGVNNSSFIKSSNNYISYPSGIGQYNNYAEKDIYGKDIVSVNYSKTGAGITQHLKTTSPDGTTVEKITNNSGNSKSFNLVITDKMGNKLLEKSKSYERLDADRAKTVVNGEIYNISGLSGDILSVEHNGKVEKIDLPKLTDEKVEKMVCDENHPDANQNFVNRNEKITDKEREILYSKIKSMSGDELLALAENIDEIAFLDTPDNVCESFYNNRALIYSKDINSLVILHELGHGINHKISDEKLLTENPQFKNIRDYEIRNYKQNKTTKDTLFDTKFTNPDNLIAKGECEDKTSAESRLRDEIFAESYAVLNTTDILDFDDNIQGRTLSLIKYCPRTLAQVNNYV